MQKIGAGMTTASSCYWDPDSDGHCTIVWENNTINCIVTVYGSCISPNLDKNADT